MDKPSAQPQVYGVPIGVDFPQALVAGLRARFQDQPPEALARLRLIVNTRRMARRVRTLFDEGPPCLLPQILLVSDLEALEPSVAVPPATSPLRRQLDLARLLSALLERQPDLAPRAHLYDLARSLAGLLDEMHGEGVAPEAIASLDVSAYSAHWARSQAFLEIATRYIQNSTAAPDAEARRRAIVQALIAQWDATPPSHPILIAGSTGSRGTTALLMRRVAQLPGGAVVLPGFDFDLPETVWDALCEPSQTEDHPQYLFAKLMQDLGITRQTIQDWHPSARPCAPDRNKLISLSLRPAPFTDAWLREGPRLPPLEAATQAMSLIEARDPRQEANAIAMRLRAAAEAGQKAALITPDRMLSRRVSAALDRWNITPDDSAGEPLHLSAPGRFLRQCAGLFEQPLTVEKLLALLKHPLCHSGETRSDHLLLTRNLELYLRRNGAPYPDARTIAAWAETQDTPLAQDWATWLCDLYMDRDEVAEKPLADWCEILRALAERSAAGCAAQGTGGLWERKAGQAALGVVQDLERHAAWGGAVNAGDFTALLDQLLSQQEVRSPDTDPGPIMIWGTLEARVQGADLVILGGLNEGAWPEAAAPDPWLNRPMRKTCGLLLPEQRIGLSALDYTQAVAAPEVWLTRALRSDDAETVAARWLNRLTNLIQGVPTRGGPAALAAMRARGATWLARADAFEAPVKLPPAPRPAPRPPRAARPKSLYVTDIKRLIRDPYAIYAKHILRLRPLDPLVRDPDAPLRGILVHEILERFITETLKDPDQLCEAALLRHADAVLAAKAPWPATRALWRAGLGLVAPWFLNQERARRGQATPVALEGEAFGAAELGALGFTIKGRADRIDVALDGSAHLYDYKTGSPPSGSEQAKFDKQLLLEAAMIEAGGFAKLGAKAVSRAVFIGLGTTPKEVPAPMDKEPPSKTWEDLAKLIAAYLDPAQGFTARRMMQRDSDAGDYDQLARFGEWDATSDPQPEDMR